MKSPDKFDRYRAQDLINKGLWLEQHETILKLAQSVLCEKWSEAQEAEETPSFLDFALNVDDAMDAIIETIAKLRNRERKPFADHDGSVIVPYGCKHTVQLLPPIAEPDKQQQTDQPD